ncbi:hypothetical protein U5640_43165 [Streptomyces sp. SS7]|uniref:hypothetical protein n=1 Tax=Streptomyces sp. SS7 TaxID=3108485 RepID=UPI0030EBF8BF
MIAAWYATDRLRRWAGPGGTVAAIDGRLRAAVEDKAASDALCGPLACRSGRGSRACASTAGCPAQPSPLLIA